MTHLHVCLLAIVQGFAELLPVSSSAHVIVAEKMLGLDPTSPEMTFLLVMLHTGTMLAVIVHFGKEWWAEFSGDATRRNTFAKLLIYATAITGFIGLALKKIIEKTLLGGRPHAEIEELFGNMHLIAAALFAAGVLIIWAGWRERQPNSQSEPNDPQSMPVSSGVMIGAIQGLCLPFRGFSRSGSTISAAMLLGIPRRLSERFSFALAVILTPPVVARELWRLRGNSGLTTLNLSASLSNGGLGLVFSFIAGLIAMRWLSSWLENGKWSYFGYYCLAAAAVVLYLS